MKKAAWLLIIVILIAILNAFLMLKYPSYTGGASSAEASINILIESSCGDGLCNGAETCSSCSIDCGGCAAPLPAAVAGGGGGVPIVLYNFSAEPSLIKVALKQSESYQTGVRIKNTEKTSGQSFKVYISENLMDFVSVSDYLFSLLAGQEKLILLNFNAAEKADPGTYAGYLTIETASRTKKVPIILIIETRALLFDVSLDIPAEKRELLPGEELVMQLTLFSLKEIGLTLSDLKIAESANVSLNYIIKDFLGNEILTESEMITVNKTQTSLSKSIKLPLTIKQGDYIAIVEARHLDSVGVSSEMFHVIEKERPEIISLIKNRYFIMVAILIIFSIAIVVFLGKEAKKMRNIVSLQMREIKLISKEIRGKRIAREYAESIKNRTQRQLTALGKAYTGKYISKKAYFKGKERIENLIRKVEEKYL